MTKIWNFIKHKKWWVTTSIVIIVVIVLFASGKKDPIITEAVSLNDISETILTTGQVVSDVDLPLSLPQGGIIENVLPLLGSKVYKGQLLAYLNQGSEIANLNKAEASLLRAQAKYDELVEGATSEEIAVARVALTNAQNDLVQTKTQQDSLVSNAYRSLLSDGLEATSVESFDDTPPTISGTYTGTTNGIYTIRVYPSGDGLHFNVGGINESDSKVDTTKPVPFGTSGLFIQFDGTTVANRTWIISVPNTNGTSYVANLNAYESVKETRDVTLLSKQSIVDARRADLDNLIAEARPTELRLAEADILSAKGDVAAATAKLEDIRLRAPGNGTITRVDHKKGEIVQPYETILVLQDIGSLYLEANINEANITNVVVGMPVVATFDAFGGDQEFHGEVSSIDIGSTLVSGVVNYKIKAKLDDRVVGLRPGMTANMTVIVNSKDNVLTIPDRAVTEKDGIKYVNILVGNKQKEVPVKLGLSGDDGNVEVKEGLSLGDLVILK